MHYIHKSTHPSIHPWIFFTVSLSIPCSVFFIISIASVSLPSLLPLISRLLYLLYASFPLSSLPRSSSESSLPPFIAFTFYHFWHHVPYSFPPMITSPSYCPVILFQPTILSSFYSACIPFPLLFPPPLPLPPPPLRCCFLHVNHVLNDHPALLCPLT